MVGVRKGIVFLTLSVIFSYAPANVVSSSTRLNEEEQIQELLKTAEELQTTRAQEALELAFSALQFSDSIKNERLIGLSKKTLGVTFIIMHRYKNAIPYLKESLPLLQKNDLTKDIAIVNLNLGRAYRENDAYILAEISLNDCIEDASSIYDTLLIGQAYYMLAKVYRKKSDYVSGLEACIKCLEIANITNNKSLQAGCENEMGHVFLNQGNTDDALKYYNNALLKKLATDDSSGIADMYISIGNLYRTSEKNWQAIEYYKKASDFIPRSKYQPNVFNIPFNTGIAYYNLNLLKQARLFLLKAAEIAKTQDSQSNIANVKIWMASVFMDDKNFEDALSNLNQALIISEEIASLEVEKNAYLGFYKFYEKTKKYEQALDSYKKYTETQSKILNNENEMALDEMRLIYESERQAHEINDLQNKVLKQELDNTQLTSSRNIWILIALLAIVILITGSIIIIEKRMRGQILKEKNKELQEAVKKLEESIQTKDKLFSIIGHDLSNPFNSILGFAELLITSNNQLTTDQVEKYGFSIHSSAQKAYYLLQNLLSWSRLQLGKFIVKKVDVQLTLLVEKEVVNCYELAQNKNIAVINKISPSINFKVDASMLSIVIRNLITNAIKFSPINSEVNISAKLNDEHVDIKISDAGIGIPKERVDKLFSFSTNKSTPGTEGEQGTGLGLVLSYELVKLNNGNINVESVPGKTDFIINLPLV